MPRSVLLLVVPDVELTVPVPVQVADSFVGRYFRLEGSGHPKEREGSRFLVRPLLFPTFAAILTTTTTMPDRDPRWPYNMGEYTVRPLRITRVLTRAAHRLQWRTSYVHFHPTRMYARRAQSDSMCPRFP